MSKQKSYEAFRIMEAIKILHPETTAEALEDIHEYDGYIGPEAKMAAVQTACRIACEALTIVLHDYYMEDDEFVS